MLRGFILLTRRFVLNIDIERAVGFEFQSVVAVADGEALELVGNREAFGVIHRHLPKGPTGGIKLSPTAMVLTLATALTASPGTGHGCGNLGQRSNRPRSHKAAGGGAKKHSMVRTLS